MDFFDSFPSDDEHQQDILRQTYEALRGRRVVMEGRQLEILSPQVFAMAVGYAGAFAEQDGWKDKTYEDVCAYLKYKAFETGDFDGLAKDESSRRALISTYADVIGKDAVFEQGVVSITDEFMFAAALGVAFDEARQKGQPVEEMAGACDYLKSKVTAKPGLRAA